MQKYALGMVVINSVLFLLFIFSVFFQEDMFAQTSYTTIHLTRSSWGFITVNVQDFYYYPNGTLTPTSGPVTYPNYPFIISYIFMIANITFAAALLRTKQAAKAS